MNEDLFSDLDDEPKKKKKSYYDDSWDSNPSSERIRDKSTSIRQLIKVLEARLSGYEWNANTNKFDYTGRVMCGRSIINKATGLLQPFAEEANLITNKEHRVISNQKWELNSTFNETLLADIGCWAENQKVILKMFKNTVQNIFDIIKGSRGLIEHSFKSSSQDYIDSKDL